MNMAKKIKKTKNDLFKTKEPYEIYPGGWPPTEAAFTIED